MSKTSSDTNADIADAEIITVESQPAVSSGTGRGSSVLGGLALLVALAAAGGVGWMWQQLKLQDNQRDDVLTELQTKVASAASNASVDEAKAAALAAQQATNLVAQQQQEQASRLQAMRDALEDLHAIRREDWRLAEAEYLLRLASQSVLMGREIRGAQALLRAADEILQEQDSPRWHPVRAAIANDMASLRIAGQFDLQGTYLRLAALETRIPALEAVERGMLGYDVKGANDSVTDEAPSWWIWAVQLFDRYVLIRRNEAPVEPLLAPEQDQYLRMNLQLLLEQAKLALMASEQVVYVDALTSAKRLVNNRFQADTATNEAFRTSLAELADVDISPTIPDLSDSLNSMRQQMALSDESVPAVIEPNAEAAQ